MTKAEILAIIPQNGQTALTDAATVTWDFSLGNAASVTLAGNRTLSITNMPNNSSGILFLTQDATGSRTLSVTGKKESGWALSTGANKTDMLAVYKDSSGNLWWPKPSIDFA